MHAGAWQSKLLALMHGKQRLYKTHLALGLENEIG